jgi:hypothetical protein
MGIKKKWVPGCGCCGGCTFENSDDNEYGLDEFNTLSAEWTYSFPTAVTVSGGKLLATDSFGFGTDLAVRVLGSAIPDVSGLKIIVQATIWRHSSSTSKTGICVSSEFFRANWATGTYHIVNAIGTYSISVTPADGDRLTMKIQKVGDNWERCYFVNGTEIASYTSTSAPFSGSWSHGVIFNTTAIGPGGEWDDYTCHKGNP